MSGEKQIMESQKYIYGKGLIMRIKSIFPTDALKLQNTSGAGKVEAPEVIIKGAETKYSHIKNATKAKPCGTDC
jgi:hypothetical protein